LGSARKNLICPISLYRIDFSTPGFTFIAIVFGHFDVLPLFNQLPANNDFKKNPRSRPLAAPSPLELLIVVVSLA